jgi:Tfp pilus assembly protein PilE
MKKSKHGFSLVECMVYSCLVGYLAVAIVPSFLYLTGVITRLQRMAYETSALCATADFWYRDMSERNQKPHLIELRNDSVVILSTDTNVHVGWYIRHEGIERVEGHYTHATKTWEKSVKSMVCTHVISGSFSMNESGSYNMVDLCLTTPHASIKRTVWI